SKQNRQRSSYLDTVRTVVVTVPDTRPDRSRHAAQIGLFNDVQLTNNVNRLGHVSRRITCDSLSSVRHSTERSSYLKLLRRCGSARFFHLSRRATFDSSKHRWKRP